MEVKEQYFRMERERASITSISISISMHACLLLLALLLFIPNSETSLFTPVQKTVIITNNHTNYLSVRCFLFDNSYPVHHLKSKELFGFRFRPNSVFPSMTMFNCSTNMGAFVAYKYDYDCASDPSNKCEWRFDQNQTYLYHESMGEWVALDYNPNYESLEKGGVVKGRYTNKK
ncbi:hypothetical protein RJ639_030435 [Escallonia herrerae]|uniref:S-protein homolog n=1 Tax=Escallonia herrerae TaxID=1293975 RepID=A0AA88X670_9ASTE|nr:hypothetical protein RJ639_030435 [Escallonia herrerae]